MNEVEPIPVDSGVAKNTITELDDNANAVASSSAAQVTSVQKKEKQTKKPFRLEPTDMTPAKPPLGNKGLPWALNTIATVTRLLNKGVQGTKKLVEGSTDLTAQAVGGVGHLGNGFIDGVQNVIDKGADRTLNRFIGWMDATNSYRKGLSGMTAKPEDRAHSVTFTTSSNAPLTTFKSVGDLVSSYLPSGASSVSLPEITSIDLSKLW